MAYSTIYDMQTAMPITDGVQSQAICDATNRTARSIAADRGSSVIVEDRGTRECYRVTPAGHRWAAPKTWPQPTWGDDTEM